MKEFDFEKIPIVEIIAPITAYIDPQLLLLANIDIAAKEINNPNTIRINPIILLIPNDFLLV